MIEWIAPRSYVAIIVLIVEFGVDLSLSRTSMLVSVGGVGNLLRVGQGSSHDVYGSL